jgi:hypothetical protein
LEGFEELIDTQNLLIPHNSAKQPSEMVAAQKRTNKGICPEKK